MRLKPCSRERPPARGLPPHQLGLRFSCFLPSECRAFRIPWLHFFWAPETQKRAIYWFLGVFLRVSDPDSGMSMQAVENKGDVDLLVPWQRGRTSQFVMSLVLLASDAGA